MFPKFLVPQVLYFITLYDSDVCRWFVCVHRKHCGTFADHAFRKERHRLRVERRYQMFFGNCLKIARKRHADPDVARAEGVSAERGVENDVSALKKSGARVFASGLVPWLVGHDALAEFFETRASVSDRDIHRGEAGGRGERVRIPERAIQKVRVFPALHGTPVECAACFSHAHAFGRDERIIRISFDDVHVCILGGADMCSYDFSLLSSRRSQDYTARESSACPPAISACRNCSLGAVATFTHLSPPPQYTKSKPAFTMAPA